jgi:hypothetical protein
MPSANWAQASQLQANIPHTYTAMEHLIMAMADAFNNRGKTSFFGHDKGLKSYLKFEEKLKNALLAMVMDGLLKRSDSAATYLEKLLLVIDAWEAIFPNWPDAHAFAYEKLRSNPSEARKLITNLIGVKG